MTQPDISGSPPHPNLIHRKDEDMSKNTTDELSELLEKYAEAMGEYINFGSPFNSDEDNIAGAEALYHSATEEAKDRLKALISNREKLLLDRVEKEVIGENEELGADWLTKKDGANVNHKLQQQRQTLATLRKELDREQSNIKESE